jgi:hypothetical protein
MSDKSFIYGLLGGAIAGYLSRPKQVQTVTQIIQTTQPQPPQIFDYIINLYTDKIDITGSDGSKTTLNTIDELNKWLTSVTGKNILIWNNGYMSGDFEPTSNRYVVMGLPTRFRTVLKNSDMDIYYFAQHNPEEESTTNYMTNYGEYQLNNVNIFAIGQPIIIDSPSDEHLENIHITAIGSRYFYVKLISGGVTAIASHADIYDSALVDGLMLTAGTAEILNTIVGKHLYLDIGYMSTRPEIYLTDTVHMVYYNIDKIPVYFPGIMPYQTVSADIVSPGLSGEEIYITGVYKALPRSIMIPIEISKDNVDVTVNTENETIIVTNKPPGTIDMVVIYSMAISRP